MLTSASSTVSLKSCLIIDDSPTVRKLARRIIEKLEIEVNEAENGQIALDMCAVRMPDAILLDWNMPVMNGITFLRLLRRRQDGSAPHVVFCTTESDVEHIREAIEAGANEYLIKPFDRESLCKSLGVVTGVEVQS